MLFISRAAKPFQGLTRHPFAEDTIVRLFKGIEGFTGCSHCNVMDIIQFPGLFQCLVRLGVGSQAGEQQYGKQGFPHMLNVRKGRGMGVPFVTGLSGWGRWGAVG